ncbi:Alpha/Beta hydrolase protein [Rhodotorula diobovata]|uniref:Alpha/Beta hydrolase protein n=1 Tax=Rhodotorula diobovata TaxID=5288 RepID=A0A5C5G2L7_9BASI|nr:Alpha/Beta hydrolase protein [Rhodotorula diobovata]
MGDNYRDYSKRTPHVDRSVHPDAAHESGGNTRGVDGEKNWQDMSSGDLKRAAEDQHDRPLGTFVGEEGVKEREGDEYLGGSTAFGGAWAEREQAVNADSGDIGRAAQAAPPAQSRPQPTTFAAPAAEPSFRYEPEKQAPRDFFSKPSDLGYDANDRSFVHELPRPPYPTLTFYRRCMLAGFQLGSFIGTTLAFFLIVGVAVVSAGIKKVNPFHKSPPRARVDKEFEARVSGERFSARAAYYAEYWGYKCEDVDIETEDGFILRLHHLTSPKHEKPGYPVILQHGILSNSVTFMVNEERSLAFWLLEQGYDVYVSNIRTNFGMPHRTYSNSDPRYYAWGVKEIAMYDLPAIVDYPAYIGHSQGCGTMYIALSRGVRPDLGNKLACFISLAPAVYAGPALRKFPFSLMRKFAKSRKVWNLVFGVREFIPIISILQRYLPAWLFGHFANVVFQFVFGFHDHNWLKRQIPKFFRSVAVANSAELLLYMGVLSVENCAFDTTTTEPWFPPSMPPLAIFYGTLDTLVLGKPLIERIRSHEPHVRLVKAVALENYEHQDPLWAHTAHKECYPGILEVLVATQNGYPARA